MSEAEITSILHILTNISQNPPKRYLNVCPETSLKQNATEESWQKLYIRNIRLIRGIKPWVYKTFSTLFQNFLKEILLRK